MLGGSCVLARALRYRSLYLGRLNASTGVCCLFACLSAYVFYFILFFFFPLLILMKGVLHGG